ncbi:MAG: flagellar motor switch protein FliN [Planctomycetaceae bacterium]|nr:flagellar motor switch protein FliN [Planctomycetaceae bacterium]
MADDKEQVGQDDIEKLLQQAQDNDRSPDGDSSVSSSSSGDSSVGSSSSGDASVGQAEIESLLSSESGDPSPSAGQPVSASSAGDSSATQDDIELLMNKAEEALASIDQGGGPSADVLPSGIRSFDFQHFGGTPANTDVATLELVRDVQLDMTIELGRTHMQLEDILKLKQGAVVPLDKLAGDPADIYVNGRLIARGEVLVLNDNFCVRVAELIAGDSV